MTGTGESRGDLDDFRGGVLCGQGWELAPTAMSSFPPPLPHPQLFNDAIRLAVSYKHNSRDFMDEVLQELEVGQSNMLGRIKKQFLLRGMRNITQPLQTTHARHACAPRTRAVLARTGPDLTCILVHRTLIWSRRRMMCQTKCSVAALRASPLPESEKETSPRGLEGLGGSFRIPSPQQPSSSELKNSCRPPPSLPPASPPIPFAVPTSPGP